MVPPRRLNLGLVAALFGGLVAFSGGCSGARSRHRVPAGDDVPAASSMADGGASAPGAPEPPPAPALGDFVVAPIPADPEPLLTSGRWVFDLRYARGQVELLGVKRIDLPATAPTPRAMGRFALELYEGPALVERVRFDFPLLGAAPPEDAGLRTAPDLERGLTTRIGVLFPVTDKGRRLELLDRATGRRWPLPWPPPWPEGGNL